MHVPIEHLNPIVSPWPFAISAIDIGGRTLAHKITSQGYYWPTPRCDAETYAKSYDTCQCFKDAIHVPVKHLNPIVSPWPFAIWVIDIIGPLPSTSVQKKFLLVATDYFIKWAEAEAFA